MNKKWLKVMLTIVSVMASLAVVLKVTGCRIPAWIADFGHRKG